MSEGHSVALQVTVLMSIYSNVGSRTEGYKTETNKPHKV